MVRTSVLVLLSLLIDLSWSTGFSKEPMFPRPSGKYFVGTTIFHLIDQTRKDPADSTRFRELMVQMWYPASSQHGYAFAPYIPDSSLVTVMVREEYMNISPATLERWRNLKTNSLLDVPVFKSDRRFPLILFSHGFGMSRSSYTSICEDLASNGFIVAAIDHPASGLTVLPDGRVISLVPDPLGPDGKTFGMMKDASFVLDVLLDSSQEAGRFARSIDPERIGMFGHSLGGAAALDMGRVDRRFRACANLDGYPFGRIPIEGLHQPSLMVLQRPGEPVHISDRMRFERDSLWSAIISKQSTDTYVVTIHGTSHFSFSDLPFLVPDSLMTRNGGTIAPQRGHEIVCALLHSFFSKYLKEAKDSPLDAIAKRYPEVTFESLSR